MRRGSQHLPGNSRRPRPLFRGGCTIYNALNLLCVAALCSVVPASYLLLRSAVRTPRGGAQVARAANGPPAESGYLEGLGSADPPLGSVTPIAASHVLIALMSCGHYHQTRLALQHSTWLRAFRHIVLFTDVPDDASAALRVPTVAHAFSATNREEKTFLTGAWRAVPIMRAVAAHVRALPEAERPRWIYSMDDDAYVVVPNLLRVLARYDHTRSVLLGAATISPAGLHGIVPPTSSAHVKSRASGAGGQQVFQPYFINGGPGYALTLPALLAAFDGEAGAVCEATFTWDWMGDMRVSRCLAAKGVQPTWERGFHTEDPSTMRARGQLLSPGRPDAVAFHHLGPEQLVRLSRAHEVVARVPRISGGSDGSNGDHVGFGSHLGAGGSDDGDGEWASFDFGRVALKPLVGLFFGLHVNVTLGWDGAVAAALGDGAGGVAAPRAAAAQDVRVSELASFTAMASSHDVGAGGAASAAGSSPGGADVSGFGGGLDEEGAARVRRALALEKPESEVTGPLEAAGARPRRPRAFVQRYRGGACEGADGVLLGGHSLTLVLHCAPSSVGADGEGTAGALAAAMAAGCVGAAHGLAAVCAASLLGACAARVDLVVACPEPQARSRAGLDVGTSQGASDVARDGLALGGWRQEACSPQAGGEGAAAVGARGDTGAGGCARVLGAAGAQQLRLFFSMAVGEAELEPPVFKIAQPRRAGAPRVSASATATAVVAGAGQAGASAAERLVGWAVRGPAFEPRAALGAARDASLSAEPLMVVVSLSCTYADPVAPGAAGAAASGNGGNDDDSAVVMMHVGVRGQFSPLRIAWAYRCSM